MPTDHFIAIMNRLAVTLAIIFLGSFCDVTSAQHTIKIVSIQVEPYLMIEYDENRQIQYTGYIKDLLDAAMPHLGIGYHLYVAPDNKFGNLQPGGLWNGMVEEVRKGRAEIAAGPLYVTFPRALVVDFSRPFMNISTTFLLTKSTLMKHPYIKTIQDLMDQPDIIYGTMEVGTIVRAFKNTNETQYKQLWHKMNGFSPYAFTQSNQEGIKRVRSSKGRYAFILPSVIAEYIIGQEPCDLVTFGRFLNDRHFSLAVPKKSEILKQLDSVLLHLERTGYLASLYNKWWFQDRRCNSKSYSSHLTSAKTYGSYSLYMYFTTIFMFINQLSI